MTTPGEMSRSWACDSDKAATESYRNTIPPSLISAIVLYSFIQSVKKFFVIFNLPGIM